MKISTALRYSGNAKEAADEVIALERAGLDTIWVAEAYGFDSPTLMGYVAARTETVEIGSGIINIYSRTPSCLAQTAAGLDSVSSGRAILGLGASGPQVIEGFHGVPYERPLARTRETIEVIRQAIRREKVVFSGAAVEIPLPAGKGLGMGKPLKLLNVPVRPAVPLYVAALGAKNVELAAELADGWLPFMFAPERVDKVWGAPLAAGAARRPSELGRLEIVAGALCAIGDDIKHVLDLARPHLALYIGGMGAPGKNFYNQLACEYGYEAEAKEIQSLYLDGKKEQAAALVPQELLEMVNLVGPEGYIKERIAAYREVGVTNLQITPVAADGPALIGRMKELTA